MFESGRPLCPLLYMQITLLAEGAAFSAKLTDHFRGQPHHTDIQGLFSNKADVFSSLMWNFGGGETSIKIVENNK